MRKALMIATALLAVALPVAADQGRAAPQTTAQLGALRNAQRSNPNPYLKLFDARAALEQAVQQEAQKAAAPKKQIVCGMTIIEAPPFHDAKMGVTPPKDDTRYVIRAIDPRVCNSSVPR